MVPGGYPNKLTLAKGATVSLLVPANRIYYLAWLMGYFNTDATVIARTFNIEILLINGSHCFLCSVNSIPASQNKSLSYNVISGAGGTVPQDISNGCGNLLPIFAGQTLQITSTNQQAGDAWAIEGVYYDTYGIA